MTDKNVMPLGEYSPPTEPKNPARSWTSRLRLFRRPEFWIFLALAAATAAFFLARSRGPEVPTVVALRRDLEQHVVASGRVWVPTRIQVSAHSPGLVRTVAVREGDRVRAGDLLVQMDDAEERAALAQTSAAVAQASARVQQLRRVGAVVTTEALRQARLNRETALADLERARKLAATGSLTKVELEAAEHEASIASAKYTAAEAQQLASAPAGADSRIAVTALVQAETQRASANVQLAQTKILALQDAVVLSRSVEPGDMAQPSRPLLVLAAGSEVTQIVFQIDERNLAYVRLGQSAKVSADAYPDQVFDAQVSHLAPAIDPERGSVEVRLALATAPAFLKPEMTVSVDLLVAQKTRALVVPTESIHEASSAKPWVYVVDKNHLVRTDVKLGIRGDGMLEIASGLAEGTELVQGDGRLLQAAQRVRPLRTEYP